MPVRASRVCGHSSRQASYGHLWWVSAATRPAREAMKWGVIPGCWPATGKLALPLGLPVREAVAQGVIPCDTLVSLTVWQRITMWSGKRWSSDEGCCIVGPQQRPPACRGKARRTRVDGSVRELDIHPNAKIFWPCIHSAFVVGYIAILISFYLHRSQWEFVARERG